VLKRSEQGTGFEDDVMLSESGGEPTERLLRTAGGRLACLAEMNRANSRPGDRSRSREHVAISADRLSAEGPEQSTGVIAADGTLRTPKSTRTVRSVLKSTYTGILACQDSQEMWMLCRSPQR
jgi:hypothetical protein